MATIKGPLMSFDASGSVAETIVFSKWKGRNYVRQHVVPSNPETGLQVGVRGMLRFTSQSFATLGAVIIARWKALSDPKSITPLNSFVALNQERERQGFGCKQDPTLPEGAAEAAPAAPSATAQIKSLKIMWTDSVGADDWCTFIHMLKGGAVTPGPDTLLRIIPAGVGAYIATGLETGITYHFRVTGCETGGALGTSSADFTGIPL